MGTCKTAGTAVVAEAAAVVVAVAVVALPTVPEAQTYLLCYCSHLTFTFAFVSMSPSNAQKGFRPILCVCVSIDPMLNFDGEGDANANVRCEHSINFFPIKMSITKNLLCTASFEFLQFGTVSTQSKAYENATSQN